MDNTSIRTKPDWVQPLLSALGLNENSSVSEIFQCTDAVATRLAPDTRRLWKWILTFEGCAVLLPLLWLLVLRLRWQPVYTAYSVTVCTLIVVGIYWWLRWRGMQHTWVRSRVVAEILRSIEQTKWLPGRQTVDALVSSPMLQSFAEGLPQEETQQKNLDLAALKERYLSDRIIDQLSYYQIKSQSAERERHRLSRYVTLSLDGALFLAVTGLILVHSDAGIKMLRLSGADFILGGIGSFLPLLAILLQSLSSYLELNRRTGRYAQQIEFLQSAQGRLGKAGTLDDLLKVVQDTERSLLGEVVEWYYEAEHTESFYRSKKRQKSHVNTEVKISQSRTLTSRLLSVLGGCLSFVGRVIFGRVLVVGISMVITTALIAYYAPQDPDTTDGFRLEDGRLLSSPTSEGWNPDPSHTGQGFILIVHGLHDGVERNPVPGKKGHWMTRMQKALQKTLANSQPDIALLDWHKAAVPALFSSEGLEKNSLKHGKKKILPETPQGWLQNVAAIRPQAQEIGKLVGFKLAAEISDGNLRKDRPMHFIGHSAGGFVVMHAAKILDKLGLAPDNLHITILDTPIPQVSDIEDVLKFADVDYYCTSLFAKGVPENGFHSRYKRYDINVPESIDNFTGAHSYAHTWFIESIYNMEPTGYSRSPLAITKQKR